MSDDPELPAEESANLKFLRRLVTTLTATMIVGLVVLISLVVIRLGDSPEPPAWQPAQITLPQGGAPVAVTYGPGWYLVVTADDRILVFDQSTSELMQEHAIQRN